MSRIGRMPIAVPSGVEVTIAGQLVSVKGPKGSLSLNVAEPIKVSQDAGVITVARPNEERVTRSLHGLSRSLVSNMVEGVTNGYTIATKFFISGIDKQLVGEVAAKIKKLRKADPYKGKGLRISGEVVRRKQGKTGKK